MTTNTPFTEEEIKLISEKLQRSLGPEFLTQRPGPSGRLTYIEGKTAINLANEIFGFNGWTSEIKDTTVDFADVLENGRVNLGVSVTVRISLKDGTFHEDIGYGSAENSKSKAIAFEKAKKQAVTDATKRTLRNFGNALGNCIYDKVYLSGIARMANPQIKFTPVNLYRHSQFDTSKNASTSDATTTTTTDSSEPTTSTANVRQSNNATNIKPETVSTNDSVRSAHVPATTSSAPQSIPRYQPLIPEDEGDDMFDQDFNETDLQALECRMNLEHRENSFSILREEYAPTEQERNDLNDRKRNETISSPTTSQSSKKIKIEQ
ncbi:Putative DNA repair and recombination protein RAD52 [Rhizopus microsporus]|nr:Putative DNA repair and recombination protein RAD52 [Rhizopus microsporus]